MNDKPIPILVAAGLLFLGSLFPWWSLKSTSLKKAMRDYENAPMAVAKAAGEEFGQAQKVMEENKDWYRSHTASLAWTDEGSSATVYGFSTWTGMLGLLGALVVAGMVFAPVPIPEQTRYYVIGGIGVFLSLLLVMFWLFSPGKNVGEFLQQGTGILIFVPMGAAITLAVIGVQKGRSSTGGDVAAADSSPSVT